MSALEGEAVSAKTKAPAPVGAPRKYQHTDATDAVIRDRYDGRVRNRTQAIARTLGWPKWAVLQRAAALGVTRPWPPDRKPWNATEQKFLVVHAGSRTAAWMARQLGRSLSSTVCRLKRMKISMLVTDGYTKTTLATCFGIDHRGVEAWARDGLLRVDARDGAGSRVWQVGEAEVLRFIRNNPARFRLDKVDQGWFMDLIAPGLNAAIKAAEGRA